MISIEDYMKYDQLQLIGYTDSDMLDVSTIKSPCEFDHLGLSSTPQDKLTVNLSWQHSLSLQDSR